jgi:hypothetical protein
VTPYISQSARNPALNVAACERFRRFALAFYETAMSKVISDVAVT